MPASRGAPWVKHHPAEEVAALHDAMPLAGFRQRKCLEDHRLETSRRDQAKDLGDDCPGRASATVQADVLAEELDHVEVDMLAAMRADADDPAAERGGGDAVMQPRAAHHVERE